MRLRWFTCAAVLAAAGAVQAEPFTIANALASQLPRYPAMTVPVAEVPQGVTAYPNLCYARLLDAELCLDLYVPSAPAPAPLVLLVHGGGWDSGSREMERPLALALAARGYATATVSYRLGPDGRFPNALHDLKGSVRWMRAKANFFHIDPTRIAILGGSAGGTLAALVGATNEDPAYEGTVGENQSSSRVQAVIDIDGLVDFTDPALLAQQTEHPSAPTRFLGGPYAERTATWRAASPLTHVRPASTPTLFLCSTATSPLLPGRETMLERLRANGVHAERVVIPDTPHVFWLFNPWFPQVVDACDTFLKHTLVQNP